MPLRDFTAPRLHLDADLSAGIEISVNSDQVNYLRNVLRLGPGDAILVFNGRDGEWRAEITEASKRAVRLTARTQTRPQSGGPDLDYLFAPLKRARLDYMVQKATELGVARLRPVLTRNTIAERVNLERMRANVVEAAEQCGVLRVPEVLVPQRLEAVLAEWDPARRLIFCDEGAEVASPIAALAHVLSPPLPGGAGRGGEFRPSECGTAPPPRPSPTRGEGEEVPAPGASRLAVLIGPEGGFAAAERTAILAVPGAVRLSLGPRIMRADTAAVAALALVNAVLGDWR